MAPEPEAGSANGAVLLGRFGKEDCDDAAAALLAEIADRYWGGRQVIQINAVRLWNDGGGIHCVTQQQRSRANPPGHGLGIGSETVSANQVSSIEGLHCESIILASVSLNQWHTSTCSSFV